MKTTWNTNVLTIHVSFSQIIKSKCLLNIWSNYLIKIITQLTLITASLNKNAVIINYNYNYEVSNVCYSGGFRTIMINDLFRCWMANETRGEPVLAYIRPLARLHPQKGWRTPLPPPPRHFPRRTLRQKETWRVSYRLWSLSPSRDDWLKTHRPKCGKNTWRC